MTVFLRTATEAPEDKVTPASPTLAMLYEAIHERQPYLRGEPLLIDSATYQAAESEMKAIRKARGYSDMARAQLSQRNFLLFGVPIVSETDP